MNWLKGRFIHAFDGLYAGVFRDRSIRFQCVLGLMAVCAGLILHLQREEWLWILLAITLVIVTEVLNSCIEKTVDYISLEIHPQAKLIKDMAAAAVFIVSCFAFLVALLIYLPALQRLWQNFQQPL